MKKVLFFISCTFACNAAQFDSLTSLNKYVQSLEEQPKYNNPNHLDPDYTDYYMNHSKSFIRRRIEQLLSYTGISPSSGPWPIQEFERLLRSLTELHNKQNISGEYIYKLIPKKEARLIIWGDLQGALHSLVRDLNELKRQNIITESLQMVTKKDYLFFNGDLIDRSPYSIEILTVVMTLMEKNPQHVFYIKGNHETGKNWHDYGLKRELKIKAADFNKEKIPFDSLVRSFFDTLPLAVFVQGLDKKKNEPAFVRISHYDAHEMPLVHEDNFADFLLQKQKGPVSMLAPKQRKKDPEKFVQVKAAIKGVSRSTTYKPTDGLELLIPERGATSWTVLSSPTETYNELYKFYNDAFTIIRTHEYIGDWAISLYTQDIRTKNGFKAQSYHLMSGRPLSSPDEKINLEEVVIGSINDVTKSTSTLGKSLREGLSLKINKSNKEGEVPGKYIRIIFLDDEYTPHKTVQAMNKLKKKYGTDIILTTLGTPTQEALLPYIKNKEIAVLFGYSGAGKFRTSDLTNTVHYRTSYEREAYVLVEYGVKHLSMKRFAIVYQNDAFGKALRDGARVALHEFDCEWIEESYPRNTLNIESAAEKIKKFDPEVILLFGTRAPSYALIQHLGVPYVSGKHLMGGSFLTDAFRHMIEPRGLGLTITRVVPDPYSDLPIAKEYRKTVLQLNPEDLINVDIFEGYINASLFIEALKNSKGPITKESLMNYFHSLKDKDFKGLKLSYDPTDQELSQNREVGIDDGKIWTKLPGLGWKHKPEKALPPGKIALDRKVVSLYLQDKSEYTDTQLIRNFFMPDHLLGMDYDSIQKNILPFSFCMHELGCL